jgi:hypothetical protein
VFGAFQLVPRSFGGVKPKFFSGLNWIIEQNPGFHAQFLVNPFGYSGSGRNNGW